MGGPLGLKLIPSENIRIVIKLPHLVRLLSLGGGYDPDQRFVSVVTVGTEQHVDEKDGKDIGYLYT